MVRLLLTLPLAFGDQNWVVKDAVEESLSRLFLVSQCSGWSLLVLIYDLFMSPIVSACLSLWIFMYLPYFFFYC